MPPQVSDVLHGQSGRVCGKLMVELVTQAFYWLVVSIPLKNMKVNWDDYSQYMEKIKMFQTINQIWINYHNSPQGGPF